MDASVADYPMSPCKRFRATRPVHFFMLFMFLHVCFDLKPMRAVCSENAMPHSGGSVIDYVRHYGPSLIR
jgi:hypothetical protein